MHRLGWTGADLIIPVPELLVRPRINRFSPCLGKNGIVCMSLQTSRILYLYIHVKLPLPPPLSLNSLFRILQLFFNYRLPNSLRLKITSTSSFISSLTYLFLLKSNPPLSPRTVYSLDASSLRLIFFSCFCRIYI